MGRIPDAFENLLRKGAYETITFNEIAKKSATGAGSIYARFGGKRSILLALHARAHAASIMKSFASLKAFVRDFVTPLHACRLTVQFQY